MTYRFSMFDAGHFSHNLLYSEQRITLNLLLFTFYTPLFGVAAELGPQALGFPLVACLGFVEVLVGVLEGREPFEQVLYLGVVLGRRFDDLVRFDVEVKFDLEFECDFDFGFSCKFDFHTWY